jgi:hypothetical protein
VESLCVDLCLGLCEKFAVVFPKNGHVRGDGFKPSTMETVCEFTCELVESVEVTVELVQTVGRPDEAAVTEPFEYPINGVTVVISPCSEVRDGSRLIEIIEDLEGLPRQQFREVDVGVLPDEILVDFYSPGIRGNDSLPTAVPFRVEQPFFDEVRHGTREIALAVVELRCKLGDCVAAFDDGEDFKFDTPEHSVT